MKSQFDPSRKPHVGPGRTPTNAPTTETPSSQRVAPSAPADRLEVTNQASEATGRRDQSAGFSWGHLRRVAAPAAAALVGILVGLRTTLPPMKSLRRTAPDSKASQASTLAAVLPRHHGTPVTLLTARNAKIVDASLAKVSHGFQSVQARLQSLGTTRPGVLARILSQVYGDRMTPQAKAVLIAAARKGEFPMPAHVQIVAPEDLQGADAAYSSAGFGKLFISEAIIDQPERLAAVILEEAAHYVDSGLGAGDAVGDEGQLFRLAVELGRTLTQPELRSGRLDRDRGELELNGARVSVEFSHRAEDRAYEASGTFSEADITKGALARLAEQVDAEVIARAAAENPAIDGLEAAQAHFEGAGQVFADVRAAAEKAIVGDDRDGYLKTVGQDLVKEAVTSSVLVRLIVGGVLPDGTTSATRLSPRTQAVVDGDEALSRLDPKVETYGALMTALAGDVDADGKLDFDALTMGRFLLGADAQQVLRAIQSPITATEMREKLRGVGFESPILDGFSIRAALELTPPKLFGLAGATQVDKTQQQLLLRTGKVFVDSNEDGKVGPGDAVHFVDRDGTIKQTTYDKLPSDLKKLVQLNMATAKVAEDYASLPSSRRMRFPHYHSATGQSDPERVNETFWTISVAQANRGQVSWELKSDRPVRTIADVEAFVAADGRSYDEVRSAKRDALAAGGAEVTEEALDLALISDHRGETVRGHRPSEALDDVFTGNGGMYTTECAHGRTLIRLQGLQAYYQQAFGEGLGRYKFDLRFAATGADRAKAQAYVDGFEPYQAAHEGATWADYVAAEAPPEIAYALEVSRHRVFGKNESVIEPWKRAEAGAGAGDTGYFHNYSVSVEGVKIGYVGENVIDLGYQGGTRRYWGHPGGVQTEKAWQGDLASKKITVHEMHEFGQYFSHTDTKRGSARVTKTRIDEIDKKIRDLRIDQPAGYEKQIKTLEGSKGWWKALDTVRKGLVDHLDRAQLEAADKFFASPVALADADDAKAILQLLTADGKKVMAKAFDGLDEETKAQAVRHFGVADAAGLSADHKAQTALFATLTQGGRMHTYLQGEARGIVETERFLAKSDWLTGEGHFASKLELTAWLASDDFKVWYEAEAGQPWNRDTDLAKLTVDDVRELVELVMPMVKGKRTVYADVNRGSQLLSTQMATLLKEGKLPDAEYRMDSMAVAPLD